jgi:hypothetical protein
MKLCIYKLLTCCVTISNTYNITLQLMHRFMRVQDCLPPYVCGIRISSVNTFSAILGFYLMGLPFFNEAWICKLLHLRQKWKNTNVSFLSNFDKVHLEFLYI